MQEAIIKSTVILLLTLCIVAMFAIRYKDCTDGKCPNLEHAVEKWEALTK